MELYITDTERDYLRSLAYKQMKYSSSPVMEERKKQWYNHNKCISEKPLFIIEADTFIDDITGGYKCASPFARRLEQQLLLNIIPYEYWDDDTVVPDFLELSTFVGFREYGFDIPCTHSVDSNGRNIAFHYEYPFDCLSGNLGKLKPFTYNYSPESCAERYEVASSLLGDILPIVPSNNCHRWSYMLTEKAIRLVGLEQWMISMYDEPDEVHALMRYLTDGLLGFIDFQEKENCFTMNNGNCYTGAGSRGFTDELREPTDKRIKAENLWCNMNSQESSSISPEMYKEFIYPYYAEIANRFGLVYYGCCEPVHSIWDTLKNLPHLKKVSVSAWCDEKYMGERLKGGNIIYSRKPSPHFLGIDKEFDEDGFKKHIQYTLDCSKGCHTEIIFRDVYTLCGDLQRPSAACKILRKLIEK